MRSSKSQNIIGVDEVGRGPLAGPVSVCSVIMSKETYTKMKRSRKFQGLHNSKALSEKQREEWSQKIHQWKREGLLNFSYASLPAKQIDKKGIAVAIRACLSRTLKNLKVKTSDQILLDGSLFAPQQFVNQKTIIKGDEKESIISLASIVAKVRRDNFIKKISSKYPEYGLEQHKGYGTLHHRKAIKKHGMSELHRKSFCKNI